MFLALVHSVAESRIPSLDCNGNRANPVSSDLGQMGGNQGTLEDTWIRISVAKYLYTAREIANLSKGKMEVLAGVTACILISC